jgi:hypothetical protein
MTKAVCLFCAKTFTHWRNIAANGALKPSKHMKVIRVLIGPLPAKSHAVSPLSSYLPTASGFKTVPQGTPVYHAVPYAAAAHVLTWSKSDITALWLGNTTAALAARYEPSGFTASLHGTDDTNKWNSRWYVIWRRVSVVTEGQRQTKTKKTIESRKKQANAKKKQK